MNTKFEIIKSTVSKIATKAINTINHNQTAQILKQTKQIESKPLFCHEYWKACKEQGVIRQTNKDSVSLHGYLNGINHHFINPWNPQSMNLKTNFTNPNMTPREIISLTDMEFKELKPTEKTLHVIRCIGEKPDFFSEYKLYQKRLGIKKGDVIDMKEYSYATSNKSYATGYLTNNRGIMYEIEVPKNSRVSRTGNETCDEIVFPRSSQFECIGTERIKDSDKDYLHVKLRYIQPKEPWRTS